MENASERVAHELAGEEIDERAIEEPDGKAVTHYGPRVRTIVAGAGDDPPLKPARLVLEIEDSRTGPQVLIVGRVPAADESRRGSADRPPAPQLRQPRGARADEPYVGKPRRLTQIS